MHKISHLEILEGIIHNPAVFQAHTEISDKLEGNEQYLPLEGYAPDMLGSVALFHLASISRMELRGLQELARDEGNGGRLYVHGARIVGEVWPPLSPHAVEFHEPVLLKPDPSV